MLAGDAMLRESRVRARSRLVVAPTRYCTVLCEKENSRESFCSRNKFHGRPLHIVNISIRIMPCLANIIEKEPAILVGIR